MKIEHLGIAVKSLETSDHLFAKLFGKDHYKHETIEREGVTTSFFAVIWIFPKGADTISFSPTRTDSLPLASFRACNFPSSNNPLCQKQFSAVCQNRR